MAQSIDERYRVAPVRRRQRQWPFPLNLYQTATGRKWVMAVTGLGLIGFVIVHMVGNLHLYEGQPHGFFNRRKSEEHFLKTVTEMDRFLESLGYLKGEPTIR